MHVPDDFVQDPLYNFIVNGDVKEIELALPLSFARRILSLCGALPCTGKRPHWPILDKRKANVFLNAAIYSVLTAIVLFVAVQKKIEYEEIDPSYVLKRSFIIKSMLLLIPHVVVCAVWTDASVLFQFMELHVKLQMNFRRTTGKPLKYRRQKFENFSCRLSVVVTVGFYCILASTVPGVDPSPITCLAITYGNTIGAITIIYWVIAAMVIVDAHDDIESEFRQYLQSKTLTANKVYEFRLLWLSLRAMCDCLSQWKGSSLGYAVCLGLCVNTFYEAITCFLHGEIGAAVGNLTLGCIYANMVFILCYASHEVQEKMKYLVKDLLPNISLSSYHRNAQREILMLYVVESARPAQTTFGETLVVNRHLLLTFFSTISTYIIVIVQFSNATPTL